MKVLQIGWRYRATKALHRLGCQITIVVSKSQFDDITENPEFDINLIIVDNLKNIEDIWLRINEQTEINKFEKILAFDELNLFSASILSMLINKNDLDPFLIANMRSKYLQKSLLTSSNIPCAKFQLLKDFENHQNIGYPCILKPISGAGTVNTYLVNNQEEFTSKINTLQNQGTSSILIEEYQKYPEYCMDGYLLNGELKFWQCMKYFNNIIEIQNGKIGGARKIDFNDNPSFFHITEKFLINSLKSLNYKNGVFHLEAFYDKKVNRWIFSEAAMRVGGGGIPLFFQKFYNKDLFEVASEIFLGRKVKTLTCNTKDIIGCFNIPAPKGRILKLPLKQDFLNSCFNCVDIEWDVVEGENFPDTSIGSFIKVGTVVLKGKSIEDFNNNVQTALSWLEKEIKIE